MAIRPIQSEDDVAVAAGLRAVYAQYGCTGPGYSPSDPETDAMFATYDRPGFAYFVYESGGEVVGGCGYGAFGPSEEATCELQKLFLLPASRGQGVGQQLMLHTLEQAKVAGFRDCYLETVARMTEAMGLYRKHGFRELDGPIFGGGHASCDRWFLRSLQMLLLCVALILPACSSARVAPSSVPVLAPELRVELITMRLEGENHREKLIERGIVNLSLAEVYEQRRIFRSNADRLKEVIARYGWPSEGLIGPDGVMAAADILINADHDLRFQVEGLELLQQAWARGEGDGTQLAALTDWVRVAQGMPQVYGTQADFIEGQLQFHPIEAASQVDARRASVGLIPLAEYRRQLEEVYLIRRR